MADLTPEATAEHCPMPNADCDEPWSELLAVLRLKAAVSLEASDLVETADVPDWGVFRGVETVSVGGWLFG